MAHVTITQMAKELGLSAATVSSVLCGKTDRFTKETIERVQSLARELGYRPNQAARAMRSGRFGTIACLIGSDRSRSFLPAPLVSGMSTALADVGQSLMLNTVPEDVLADPVDLPLVLREWLADGVLINYHKQLPEAALGALERMRLPHVWINPDHDTDRAVRPDDCRAGREATEDLIARGHRRIAFVNLLRFPHTHHSNQLREEGYRRAMQVAGLEPRFLRNPDRLRIPATGSLVLEALRAPEPPTAFLCICPPVAQAAWVAAATGGVRVPEELSLVTFADDDHYHSGIYADSWVVPWAAIGRRAVSLVHGAICERTVAEWHPPAFDYLACGTVAPARS